MYFVVNLEARMGLFHTDSVGPVLFERGRCSSALSTPAAAHDFAEVYRASVPTRYPGAQPLITVGQSAAKEDFAHWNTSEGSILLQVKGDQVVAVESFDQITASNLVLILPKGGPAR
jgi:hypothetical protein